VGDSIARIGFRRVILTFTNYIQGFLSLVCKIPCKIGIMSQSNISSRTTPVRVLIVDDHLGTATTLARAIAQLGPGLDVIPATSGEEALERVKHVSADILITDMIMPGMTGLQLIEKLQNNPAGRPTFSYLITAYDVPGLRLTASRLNVTEVFTKPINPERICQVILQTVEKLSKAGPAANDLAPQKQYTILMADDQPDNLTLLTRYLEAEGYHFIKAKDGLETLEILRSEMPDLVLLDVNMPHKDGFTVLEEIRADPAIRHIPVIILTAARQDSIAVQFGLNLGADDYITKPFDRRELIARIRTKLRAKEAENRVREQLTAVLQNTSNPVLMFDMKTRLTLINPAAQHLFTDHKAIIGQTLPSGAGYDSLLQLLDSARTSNAPFSGNIVWPNQRVFSAAVTPIHGEGCVAVLHDAIPPRELEKEMRHSTSLETTKRGITK
jgi:CheY-like chemotaxis protein